MYELVLVLMGVTEAEVQVSEDAGKGDELIFSVGGNGAMYLHMIS